MPRYHFNVYDGVDMPDVDGTELPGIVLARREAIRLAGRLLEDGAGDILPGTDWQMEVTDGTGLVLFQLDFNVHQSPALQGSGKAQACATSSPRRN